MKKVLVRIGCGLGAFAAICICAFIFAIVKSEFEFNADHRDMEKACKEVVARHMDVNDAMVLLKRTRFVVTLSDADKSESYIGLETGKSVSLFSKQPVAAIEFRNRVASAYTMDEMGVAF